MLDANFLIIWGNQEEKIIADEIKFLSPNVHVCEKLSIDSLISLIKQVDLVIGPDTGPTHMAWALINHQLLYLVQLLGIGIPILLQSTKLLNQNQR